MLTVIIYYAKKCRKQQNLYTMLFVIDSIIYLGMFFLGIWEAFSDM